MHDGGHILVVDDNEINRKVLGRALKEQGHTSVTAVNGRDALERVAEQAFDVVLLDIMMPEMDGYEVLRYLKSERALRHIPVIMISAVDEMESVIRCIEMGAADYLPKPFNPALLRARINASLAEKRIHDLQQEHLREIEAYLKEIQLEREKSERLLLNILPASIAERLKHDPGIIADRFADVTVIFADIAGFTPLSAQISPEELVAVLDDVFTRFDTLAEKYGLEKIKTIGDAYMVVSGLPISRDDHAEAAAHMALEMRNAMHDVNRGREEPLHLRIGLHSGPVIAGVIGRMKFSYDLWGDTVNIASRMESHGVIDQIHVSPTTYEHLCDHYEFRAQGPTRIKGKGEMTTYLLEGQKTHD
jgi:adenylate cyclase